MPVRTWRPNHSPPAKRPPNTARFHVHYIAAILELFTERKPGRRNAAYPWSSRGPPAAVPLQIWVPPLPNAWGHDRAMKTKCPSPGYLDDHALSDPFLIFLFCASGRHAALSAVAEAGPRVPGPTLCPEAGEREHAQARQSTQSYQGCNVPQPSPFSHRLASHRPFPFASTFISPASHRPFSPALPRPRAVSTICPRGARGREANSAPHRPARSQCDALAPQKSPEIRRLQRLVPFGKPVRTQFLYPLIEFLPLVAGPYGCSASAITRNYSVSSPAEFIGS